MFNKNTVGIDINQRFTFSKLMAKTQRSSRVFLPGCSLTSLGTEIVEKTLKLLQKEMPDLALSTFCCGKPSMHINGGKDFAKRFCKLEKSFEINGVKQVVTACPNCFNLLRRELKNVEVLSIWGVLNKVVEKGYIDYCGRKLIVHDPCVTRRLNEEHESVRDLLEKMNVKVIEFEYSKEKTICCGRKNMLMVLNKPKAIKVLEKRIVQSGEHEIVSYCASCVQAFKSLNKQAVHILELIVQVEGNYSWRNRLSLAQKIK